MNENELHERYIRLAFQYESAIDALLARGLVDEEAADAAKERFYDTLNEEKLRTTQKVRDYHETISLYMRMLAHDGMVSLTELARQYSDESPGYVIQSWMRSRNTLEFLRQWELEQNEEGLMLWDSMLNRAKVEACALTRKLQRISGCGSIRRSGWKSSVKNYTNINISVQFKGVHSRKNSVFVTRKT